VGDDEHRLDQQIVDGEIVDAQTGDHLIGNAGDLCDLRRDRNPGSSNHSQEPRTLYIRPLWRSYSNRQMPSSMILSRQCDPVGPDPSLPGSGTYSSLRCAPAVAD
jgi:hypothetical protein